MTKLDKIRKALGDSPAAGEIGVPGLSSLTEDTLTTGQAQEIANLLRAARTAGRKEERAARAKRREGRRRDPDQLGHDTERSFRGSLARRASLDLDALTILNNHYTQKHEVLAMAVEGLRLHHSDTEIGMALGLEQDYARQEVRRLFGPRGSLHSRTSDGAA